MDASAAADNESEIDQSSSEEESDDDEVSTEVCDEVVDSWEEGIIDDISAFGNLEQLKVNKVVKKCRELVKMIGKSSILSMFIHQRKKKAKIKRSLLIDCRSRWNSTFRLIEAFLLYKPIVNQLYAERYVLDLTKKQLSR